MKLSNPEDRAIAEAWDRLRSAVLEVSVAQPHRIGPAVQKMLEAQTRMDQALFLAFQRGGDFALTLPASEQPPAKIERSEVERA